MNRNNQEQQWKGLKVYIKLLEKSQWNISIGIERLYT